LKSLEDCTLPHINLKRGSNMDVINILLILCLTYCLIYHYTISYKDWRSIHKKVTQNEIERIAKATYVSELGLTRPQLRGIPIVMVNYYLKKYGFAAQLCTDRYDDYRIYKLSKAQKEGT
jgi:hypothetical protein